MSKKSKLIFPRSSSREGFTDLNLAYRSQESAHQIVREMMQNSLDAQDPKVGAVNVNIEIVLCETSNIPDIESYKAAFEAAQSVHRRTGDDKKIINAITKTLDKDKISVLFCRDDGKGMGTRDMNNLLSTAVSEKEDQQAGSYGLGHLFPFRASDIRYVLYASISRDEGTIVSGQVHLASHKLGDEYRSRVGDYAIDIDMSGEEPERGFTNEVPKILESQVDKIRKSATGTGTVIAILGFNNFNLRANEVPEAILTCAARNFFTSFHEETMKLKVKSGGKQKSLDKDSIKSQLEAGRENKQGKAKGHLSGSKAWNVYLALSQGRRIQLEEADVWYRRLDDKEILTDIAREVVLTRKGMTITYGSRIPDCEPSKFSEYKPFIAVICVRDRFAVLVNDAENPEHLELSHLVETEDRGKTLKKGFMKIANEIRKVVGILDSSDDWSPDGFPILMSRPKKTKRLPDTGRERRSDSVHPAPSPDPPDPSPDPPTEPEEQPHLPEIQGASQSIKPIVNDGEISEVIFSIDYKEDSPIYVGVWAILFSGSDSSCYNPIKSRYLDIEEIVIPGEKNAMPRKAKEVVISGSLSKAMRLRLQEPLPAHLGEALRLSLRQRARKNETS